MQYYFWLRLCFTRLLLKMPICQLACLQLLRKRHPCGTNYVCASRDLWLCKQLYWSINKIIDEDYSPSIIYLSIDRHFVAFGNRIPSGTTTAPLPEGSCHVVTEGREVLHATIARRTLR